MPAKACGSDDPEVKTASAPACARCQNQKRAGTRPPPFGVADQASPRGSARYDETRDAAAPKRQAVRPVDGVAERQSAGTAHGDHRTRAERPLSAFWPEGVAVAHDGRRNQAAPPVPGSPRSSSAGVSAHQSGREHRVLRHRMCCCTGASAPAARCRSSIRPGCAQNGDRRAATSASLALRWPALRLPASRHGNLGECAPQVARNWRHGWPGR